MKKVHHVSGCNFRNMITTDDWSEVTCLHCLKSRPDTKRRVRDIHATVQPTPRDRYTNEREQLDFTYRRE